MVRLEELKVEQLKQELGKRNLRTTGTKAELKQRLVEQLEKDGQDPSILELKQRLVEELEKDGQDPSILEFEYNTKGTEQADNLGGTGNAAEKQSEEKGEDSANTSTIV
ncbi:uncharacterized protein LOC119641022 [Glossina fuscipes]|uniref:Uncharacterized protein LOC119641022 n=1 Tax=Glossina fuscipes TaxID=7396 RepID=A0A9C6DN73_9MUSC|nr:uncharacterized protein LOC119641022 [Glossina fuscipes]